MSFEFQNFATIGDLYIDMGADGTTKAYPSNGTGGKTTIVGSSLVIASKEVRIWGVQQQAQNAGEDLIITLAGGATIGEVNTASAMGTTRWYGRRGVISAGNFSCELATGTTARYRVWFSYV